MNTQLSLASRKQPKKAIFIREFLPLKYRGNLISFNWTVFIPNRTKLYLILLQFAGFYEKFLTKNIATSNLEQSNNFFHRI